MSDSASPPFGREADTVVVECQGPIGGECGRTIRRDVRAFDTRKDYRGIRCSECRRITHATNLDVVGPGGEEA